jgi:hypothetical protein
MVGLGENFLKTVEDHLGQDAPRQHSEGVVLKDALMKEPLAGQLRRSAYSGALQA